MFLLTLTMCERNYVYTIASESTNLLIINCPIVVSREDMKRLCRRFGNVTDLHELKNYPSEKFTKCFRVVYVNVWHSRTAKRKLDDLNFMGGILHVCYAPELESVEETRLKIKTRMEFLKNYRPIQSLGESSSLNEKNSEDGDLLGECVTLIGPQIPPGVILSQPTSVAPIGYDEHQPLS
ncbi:hypothetical protein QYM36_008341 [Artemia franciscana]|uniref:RNA-binding protein 48 n=1 Tax=Artemia franciscana TaxID=6661 RepID=A0AA88IGN1_ARTSF|nr:hypothetical protein QYM36_008341 [Artemia franciscana]